MSRKNITHQFTVAGQKINTETTHEFLKENHQKFFRIFQFHIRRTHQKSPYSLQIHIGLSQQQHYPESTIFKNTRRTSHGQPTITHDDYQPSSKPISPYDGNDSKSRR